VFHRSALHNYDNVIWKSCTIESDGLGSQT